MVGMPKSRGDRQIGFRNAHISLAAQWSRAEDVRSEKANYVIRRKYVGGPANDVGFIRQPDGTFDMIVSEFETGTGAYAGGHKNAKV